MKRLRHRKFRESNTELGGVSILLVIFMGTYLYGDFYVNGLDNTTYLDIIKKRHPIMMDNFSYAFLLGIRGQVTSDNSQFNLKLTTLKYNRLIENFIESTDTSILTTVRKQELKDQLTNQTQIWDCNKLNNIHCLTAKDIEAVFGKWDFVTSWNNFDRAYGDGGYHQFSAPIFDKSRQFVIVQHMIACGNLCGVEEFILFKLVDGQWKRIRSESLWYS